MCSKSWAVPPVPTPVANYVQPISWTNLTTSTGLPTSTYVLPVAGGNVQVSTNVAYVNVSNTFTSTQTINAVDANGFSLKVSSGITSGGCITLQSGQVCGPSSGYVRTPVFVTPVASTVTLTDAGSFQIFRTTTTLLYVFLSTPTASPPSDGSNVEWWVTNSSGTASSIAINSNFVIPTSSSFSSPYSLAGGKKAKFLLQYDAIKNSGQWELTSFVPGY